jgi:hypothetical protein
MWSARMFARVVWTGLIVLLICVLLSVTFPGKRNAPAAPVVATMHWYAPTRATPLSFDEITDLATCQEMQRQLALRHDGSDGAITLACRRRL